MNFSLRRRLVLALLTALLGPAPSFAEPADVVPATDEAAAPARRTPRYLLQGREGRAVSSEDFRGRWQLITFGYTACPDFCPTALLEMQQVLTALGPRARGLQPIFITVDPQRDSPAVLEAYTRAIDERLLGLGGSPELVRHAADSFKVRFEKVQAPGAAANAYTVDHSTGMFLLGPDGQQLAKFGYGTPVREIVERIERWMAQAAR